jgi:hypothetical protein
MTYDYPFASWNDYFRALGLYLNTSDYNINYAEYAKFHNRVGTEHEIIDSLLRSAQNADNAQKGLDGFLNTVRDARYTKEMIHLTEYLQQFIRAGAVPDIDIVFRAKYECHALEDEICTYRSRGYLMDALAIAYPGINVNTNIQWHCITSTEDYEQERLLALKKESVYLSAF